MGKKIVKSNYKTGDHANADLVGKTVKLVSDNGSVAAMQSRTNTRFKVKSVNFGSPMYIYVEGIPNYFFHTELEIADPATTEELNDEIKFINSEISSYKEKISELKLKIKFMKENNLKEFDEDQFKVFSVLKALNENSSDIEKAKIISELIKS